MALRFDAIVAIMMTCGLGGNILVVEIICWFESVSLLFFRLIYITKFKILAKINGIVAIWRKSKLTILWSLLKCEKLTLHHIFSGCHQPETPVSHQAAAARQCWFQMGTSTQDVVKGIKEGKERPGNNKGDGRHGRRLSIEPSCGPICRGFPKQG